MLTTRRSPRRDDGTARWVEVCFCAVALDEERPYWEQYFELVRVQDATPGRAS
jgi:hypothetical protein